MQPQSLRTLECETCTRRNYLSVTQLPGHTGYAPGTLAASPLTCSARLHRCFPGSCTLGRQWLAQTGPRTGRRSSCKQHSGMRVVRFKASGLGNTGGCPSKRDVIGLITEAAQRPRANQACHKARRTHSAPRHTQAARGKQLLSQATLTLLGPARGLPGRDMVVQEQSPG